MSFPEELKYTKDHEWLKTDAAAKKGYIGVTAYAVDQLGDVVHLDLPKVGAQINSGDSFGTIESTKTVSDLYSPVTGKVLKVNDKLTKQPELLQKEAYGEHWLIEVEIENGADIKSLLSARDYEQFVKDH